MLIIIFLIFNKYYFYPCFELTNQNESNWLYPVYKLLFTKDKFWLILVACSKDYLTKYKSEAYQSSYPSN